MNAFYEVLKWQMLAVAVGLWPGSGARAADLAADFSTARLLYEERRYAEARDIFRKLAAEQADSVELNFYLGRLALWFDDEREALDRLERAARAAPDEARIQNALGDAFGLVAQKAGDRRQSRGRGGNPAEGLRHRAAETARNTAEELRVPQNLRHEPAEAEGLVLVHQCPDTAEENHVARPLRHELRFSHEADAFSLMTRVQDRCTECPTLPRHRIGKDYPMPILHDRNCRVSTA